MGIIENDFHFQTGGPMSTPHARATDLRCDCHRLLARGVPEGIELRCPRCKSNLVLGWGMLERLARGGHEVLGASSRRGS